MEEKLKEINDKLVEIGCDISELEFNETNALNKECLIMINDYLDRARGYIFKITDIY